MAIIRNLVYYFIVFIVISFAVSALAQERDYYIEAEQAFQRCEYAKAAELYRAAYVIYGIETDIHRRSCIECAEAQRNAREQKNLGNTTVAIMWYKRILDYNPKDVEAYKFIAQESKQERPEPFNIDKFPVIYSMRDIIECDGVYKGPDWESEYQNHTKKFHKELSNRLNTSAFSVECSFKCPNAVPVNDYYENLVLLSFDTGHRGFSIFLSRAGNIIIDTNYGDFEYETKCKFKFDEWNDIQVSYNKGHVKIKCNNMSDEFMVTMTEDSWTDNDISTTYWGTSNTYKGLIRNIIVGSAPQ